MEENILTCLENFDVLWQRVSPVSPLPSPVSNSFTQRECDLTALWIQSRNLAMNYRCLAGQFHGSDATFLMQRSREAEQLARRLQAEHFLRQGECLCHPPEKIKAVGKLHRLRRLYLDETALSNDLAHAAQNTADAEFSNCLVSFSQGAARRAEENRKLLLRCFRI